MYVLDGATYIREVYRGHGIFLYTYLGKQARHDRSNLLLSSIVSLLAARCCSVEGQFSLLRPWPVICDNYIASFLLVISWSLVDISRDQAR